MTALVWIQQSLFTWGHLMCFSFPEVMDTERERERERETERDRERERDTTPPEG